MARSDQREGRVFESRHALPDGNAWVGDFPKRRVLIGNSMPLAPKSNALWVTGLWIFKRGLDCYAHTGQLEAIHFFTFVGHGLEINKVLVLGLMRNHESPLVDC